MDTLKDHIQYLVQIYGNDNVLIALQNNLLQQQQEITQANDAAGQFIQANAQATAQVIHAQQPDFVPILQEDYDFDDYDDVLHDEAYGSGSENYDDDYYPPTS
jgi:hypothetical protein